MRDFLAFCALMGCLVVLAAAIVSVFRPLPRVGLGTRKRSLAGFGLAFGLFVLTAIIIPPPTAKTSGQPVAKGDIVGEPDPEPARVEEASLGTEVSGFAERFNALAIKADKPWRIKNVNMKDGAFSYMLNDKIGLIGSTRDDKQLTGITVLSQGDGSLGSGVEAFMAMSIAYCAAADLTNLKECGPEVLELTQKFEEDGEAEKSTVNNLELSYSRSDQIGNVFSVAPVG